VSAHTYELVGRKNSLGNLLRYLTKSSDPTPNRVTGELSTDPTRPTRRSVEAAGALFLVWATDEGRHAVEAPADHRQDTPTATPERRRS